ncbi:MAG: FecR domain-containing protein [Bacillota bacterium]|nr:FecR domain-containing protein [Bacillota bacterium]
MVSNKNRASISFILIFVLLVTIISPSSLAFGAELPRRAVITTLAGSVLIQQSGKAITIQATKGMELNPGDRIITGKDSTVEIRFDDNSITRVSPNSRVELESLVQQADDSKSTSLSVTWGRIWNKVQEVVGKNSRFEVNTPAAVAGVRGTAFLVEVQNPADTLVRVYDGAVGVNKSQPEPIELPAGISEEDYTSPPTPTLPDPGAPPAEIKVSAYQEATMSSVKPPSQEPEPLSIMTIDDWEKDNLVEDVPVAYVVVETEVKAIQLADTETALKNGRTELALIAAELELLKELKQKEEDQKKQEELEKLELQLKKEMELTKNVVLTLNTQKQELQETKKKLEELNEVIKTAPPTTSPKELENQIKQDAKTIRQEDKSKAPEQQAQQQNIKEQQKAAEEIRQETTKKAEELAVNDTLNQAKEKVTPEIIKKITEAETQEEFEEAFNETFGQEYTDLISVQPAQGTQQPAPPLEPEPEPEPYYPPPVTKASITSLSGTNGSLAINFDRSLSGATSSDFVLTAKLNGIAYPLSSLFYDGASNSFSFLPVAQTDAQQVLEISITAASSSQKVKGSAVHTIVIPPEYLAPELQLSFDSYLIAGFDGLATLALKPNSAIDEMANLKITLLDREPPYHNIIIEYKDVIDGEYYPISFDNSGTAWYGSETGFPFENDKIKLNMLFQESGNYQLKLEAISVSSGTVLVELVENITVASPQISGQLQDIYQNPLVSQSVTIYLKNMITDLQDSFKVQTDLAGSFKLGNLTNGSYTIWAVPAEDSPFAASKQQLVEINDSAPATVTLPLTLPLVDGVVVGPEYTNIAGDYISVSLYDSNHQWLYSLKTDGSGKFKLGGLRGDSVYYVQAFISTDLGFLESDKVAVDLATPEVTLVLSKVQLAGQVTGPNGTAVDQQIMLEIKDLASETIFYRTIGQQGIYKLGDLADGQYLIKAVPGPESIYAPSQSALIDVNDGITNTPELNFTLNEKLFIVLNWEQQELDLDAHLTGPAVDETRFHVYYGVPDHYFDRYQYSHWSTDNEAEIITISQQLMGAYRYVVHQFSGASELVASAAKVQLYKGNNLLATFDAPSNQEGTFWHVFELDGNSIMPIDLITDHFETALVLPDEQFVTLLPDESHLITLAVGDVSSLSFNTSDQNIASVNNLGEVTALAPGLATIAISIQHESFSEPVALISIMVQPPAPTAAAEGDTIIVSGALPEAELYLYDENLVRIEQAATDGIGAFFNLASGTYYVTQVVNGVESDSSNLVEVIFLPQPH